MDELPILKADALKFLTLMRGQLSTQAVMATFGNLAALLRADSNVVHSYAALAIERLLASRVCAIALMTGSGRSRHGLKKKHLYGCDALWSLQGCVNCPTAALHMIH